MASASTPVLQPSPLKMPDSPAPALHHPTPDLQSLQGAYIGNIERLEDHAERMSEHGSDLGEEIRKLQLEQKLSDHSRQLSLQSAGLSDYAAKPFATRSRGASTSSYANSIVDVNGAARWGGYSPTGYVTSPVGSLTSGSLVAPQSAPIPLTRQRSGSRASRLGQVVNAEEPEKEPVSPQSHTDAPVRPRSVSSFTRQYDEIAQDIQDGLRSGVQEEYISTNPQDSQSQYIAPPADLPDRPPTSFSTDTTRGPLWQDFDGVHCPDTVPEEDPAAMSPSVGSRSSSFMKPPPQPLPPVAPPEDSMVFYPAPVPQMLNLPKRLSKMPAGNVQARRRTQLLESMQHDHRKSAAFLGEAGPDMKQQRKSRQSLAHLPPQLRASAYFDQPAPAQEFEVKGESAEETLESILAASAHAPVSAFTDHPFAGHVGNEVYGSTGHDRKGSKLSLDKAEARKSKSTLNLLFDKSDNRKSKSSLNLLDTRRNSSGDPLNKLKKRTSSADLGVLTVRATESRMSLGDELDEPDQDARGPAVDADGLPIRRSIDGESDIHPDEAVGEEEEVPPEEEMYFGPPTTLLAELQMRKQQQKRRNLNAGNAFPDGMHATLLELDAVAEIEKNKRKGQKVNLAWEAEQKNPEDDDSDDDVPIGVLYPGSDGLVKKAGQAQQNDWDRPLGLIEKRQLEDNEPLSRRRTRLLGVDPIRRRTHLPVTPSQSHLAVPGQNIQPESDEDEGEGETLAQRLRRLKDQKALDNALGDDIRQSTVSGDFATDMMNQFGLNEEDKSKPAPSPGNDEEETLGQRRARLQAEALARGDANPLGTRPPLRGSMSLANILSAHPIDNTNSARKVSDEQLMSSLPQGSLLHQNALTQAKRDQDKAARINRISTHPSMNHDPLVGPTLRPAPELAVAAKIQAYKDQFTPPPGTAPGRLPSMMFNPMGNMSPARSAMPSSRDSYFPPGNMGMAPPFGMSGMGMTPGGLTPQQMVAMNMSMMSMPGAGMQGMSYPNPQMGGMNNMRNSSMVNMPAQVQMQMQQQAMMMGEPPMDPRQRDLIDRWRNGVV